MAKTKIASTDQNKPSVATRSKQRKPRGKSKQQPKKTAEAQAGRHGEPALAGAQCGRHRHWSPGDIRGCAAGPGRTCGTGLRQLHGGSERIGRLVDRLWRNDLSYGVHRRVLDSGGRRVGGAWDSALCGERPAYEERAGTAHGLARMPVDPVPALGGATAPRVPAGGASVRVAGGDAAPRRIGADGRPTRAAHA